MQADALEVEAGAKQRLAEVSALPASPPATTAELRLRASRKMHDAVRRTLDRAIDRGEDPTRAELPAQCHRR